MAHGILGRNTSPPGKLPKKKQRRADAHDKNPIPFWDRPVPSWAWAITYGIMALAAILFAVELIVILLRL